jgi:hypothetical protein
LSAGAREDDRTLRKAGRLARVIDSMQTVEHPDATWRKPD